MIRLHFAIARVFRPLDQLGGGALSKRFASRQERELARYAATLGFDHSRTRGGHCRFAHPVAGVVVTGIHAGPRDVENAKATMRRRLAAAGASDAGDRTPHREASPAIAAAGRLVAGTAA